MNTITLYDTVVVDIEELRPGEFGRVVRWGIEGTEHVGQVAIRDDTGGFTTLHDGSRWMADCEDTFVARIAAPFTVTPGE